MESVSHSVNSQPEIQPTDSAKIARKSPAFLYAKRRNLRQNFKACLIFLKSVLAVIGERRDYDTTRSKSEARSKMCAVERSDEVHNGQQSSNAVL